MTTYEVLRKIASGGNATVYAARAVSLGITRTVALKKPHPHLLDDPAFEQAFRREAAVAVRLRHPNVVQVLDVIEHEGVPTLVLELVEGPTLAVLVRAWVASGATDTEGAALKIVADAARGLHALHEQRDEAGASLGLVHRDVSPQNVLVDASGIAKLSDFGLAKQTGSGEHSTTEGILKGKVGYLSPEYIRGEPVDRRSDVFALGIVLWESLAKKRLFRSEREPDVLGKILGMAIPALTLSPMSTAAVLDRIVARALARDVRERFRTALEVAEAVENAALELGLEANPTSVARAVRAFEKDPKERASAAPPAASPASNPAADIAPPAIAPITEKLAGNAQSSSPGYGSVSASAERPVADDLPTTRDLVVQAPSIPPTLSASSASVGAPTRSTRSKLLALGVATTLGLAVAAVAYRTSRAPPATPIERPVEVPSLSPSEKPTASTGDLASSRSSDSPSAVVPQRTSATASTPPLTQDAGSASTRPPVRPQASTKPGPRPNPYGKDGGR